MANEIDHVLNIEHDDPDGIKPLAKEIMDCIREYYASKPDFSRQQVLAVLNALAISAASILAGCENAEGDEPDHAARWFVNALKLQIDLFRTEEPAADPLDAPPAGRA